MRRPQLLLAALVVLATSVSAAPRDGQVLVVGPKFTTPGGDPLTSKGKLIADLFAQGLEGKCKVITTDDLQMLTRLQTLQTMVGSETAMAQLADELAGALGADAIVSLNVGKLGGTYVFDAAALSVGHAVARVETRAASLDDVPKAAADLGAAMKQKLSCDRDPIFWEGTMTYEVTMSSSETKKDGGGRTSTLDTRAHRKDDITLKAMGSAAGGANFDQTSKSHLVQAEYMTQCPSPTGYRDLPSSSDQTTTWIITGGGPTEPSVDVTLEDGKLHIALLVGQFLPRHQVQHDTGTGIACGKPTTPIDIRTESDAVSTFVDGANVDQFVPYSKVVRTQSGSRSWDVELNGQKGTATLTWNLTGK